MIIALAVGLLLRWRARYFHVHAHEHEGTAHEHVHVHERAMLHESASHQHQRPVRSRLGAYGIGLIHGVGGSAGVGILLLAAIPDHVVGVVALLVSQPARRCR